MGLKASLNILAPNKQENAPKGLLGTLEAIFRGVGGLEQDTSGNSAHFNIRSGIT
jgi:hypothetical protein